MAENRRLKQELIERRRQRKSDQHQHQASPRGAAEDGPSSTSRSPPQSVPSAQYQASLATPAVAMAPSLPPPAAFAEPGENTAEEEAAAAAAAGGADAEEEAAAEEEKERLTLMALLEVRRTVVEQVAHEQAKIAEARNKVVHESAVPNTNEKQNEERKK